MAISEIIIAIIAFVSLWIAVKSLKKSDWNSAMNTVPSIILRPRDIFIYSRRGGIFERSDIIKKESNSTEIIFTIKFECFNAGRGAAFNIKQPQTKGFTIVNSGYGQIPLYQTLNDKPFIIETQIKKNFEEWQKAKRIPVELTITYTNDQNTVFCKSLWVAKAKPLKMLDDGMLKVRKLRLITRRSKIRYSPKAFNNNL